MPFCRVCGTFVIMTFNFQKFCEPCAIRYFRNELHDGEIRQTSLKIEKSLRLPLLYFLHAYDITPFHVPQNLLLSITPPFGLRTERQYPSNVVEGAPLRNTAQEYANIPSSDHQNAAISQYALHTHRLATLGLILAILGIALLFTGVTELALITLVIESTAIIVALVSNRIEIRSWRQRLTIALVIIYWIVIIFMLIVQLNELLNIGLLSF